MFTGIIEAVGQIVEFSTGIENKRLRINTGKIDCSELSKGDSIAINGVCVTVTKLTKDCFWADLSAETLSCTTFSELVPGSPVNLERSLSLTSLLGGHLVTGHVDGLGQVVKRSESNQSVIFNIEVPHQLAKYIVKKGSISLDGVSLTVNDIGACVPINTHTKKSADQKEICSVNIIPHTLQETILGHYRIGQWINIEVDIIARYLERLLLSGASKKISDSPISKEFLSKHGFS